MYVKTTGCKRLDTTVFYRQPKRVVKPKKIRSRIGRPPAAAADRRGTPLHVLTTKSERTELALAARGEGTTLSAWVRAVLLKRARQVAKRLQQA